MWAREVLWNYSSSLWHESSNGQHGNGWAWLCSNKTLFTKGEGVGKIWLMGYCLLTHSLESPSSLHWKKKWKDLGCHYWSIGRNIKKNTGRHYMLGVFFFYCFVQGRDGWGLLWVPVQAHVLWNVWQDILFLPLVTRLARGTYWLTLFNFTHALCLLCCADNHWVDKDEQGSLAAF